MLDDGFKIEYLLSLPIYILIILAALLLHEMGHYAAAKFFKIPIKDVVIGRGKLLKSWTTQKGIEWRLRLWPIGAHVHLGDMQSRPFHQKIITIIAGPFINVAILPFLFLAFYLAFGQPSTPNRVVGVEIGLAADKAGVKTGDEFIAVNKIPLTNFEEIWRIAYDDAAVEKTYTIKRGQNIFDIAIKPDWTEYKDDDGIERKNARFGIIWHHTPYGLKSILSVNGEPTKDNEDLARTRLIENFDRPVIIAIKGPGDELRPARFNLRGDINQDLLNKDDDYYEAVFLGATKGNIYINRTPITDVKNALRYSAKLIKNVAKIPFQIFPIDKSVIQDSAAVSNENTKITNAIYRFLHLFAVASVAIGLVNLLPFPNLDGGQLLDQILKKIRGEKLTNKFRANIFALIFFLLYGAMFITNMDNLHGYIDSRVKKVHELIDQKITNPDGEQRNG